MSTHLRSQRCTAPEAAAELYTGQQPPSAWRSLHNDVVLTDPSTDNGEVARSSVEPRSSCTWPPTHCQQLQISLRAHLQKTAAACTHTDRSFLVHLSPAQLEGICNKQGKITGLLLAATREEACKIGQGTKMMMECQPNRSSMVGSHF